MPDFWALSNPVQTLATIGFEAFFLSNAQKGAGFLYTFRKPPPVQP
jgi:hypothetical protein